MSAQVIAMRKPAIDIEAKVKCRECGFEGHSLYKHIQDAHGLSAEDYIAKHPGAELLSPLGNEVMKAHFSAQAEVRYTSEPKSSIDLFAIGFGKATGYTKQMPVRTYAGFTKEHGVPDVDPNYYFPEAVSRDLIMGMEKGGRVYAHGPTGSGKCLGKGTPVMMFNGTIRPVEDVRVGDLLMGPDSFPRRVVAIGSGREPLYRVVPTKGDAYVVNESHILSLRMTNGSKRSCGIEDGSIVNIEVRDYLQKTSTFKHCAKGWRAGVDFLPLAEPLPLEPYFLGLWLGDGNSANSNIWSTEPEIGAYLHDYARRLGMVCREDRSASSVDLVTYSISKPGGKKHTHVLRQALRLHGLIDNKHVPHAYKTASRSERLELLAGIIDTDGCLGVGGYDLTLKSERLLDDVVFVARSLGFAAYKAEAKKTCANNGVEDIYYRCWISGDIDQIPCRVERKKATPRQQVKNVLNVGITLEPLGEGDYYGFQIEGPDRLFLLGDFTVTHNTTWFEQFAARTGRPFWREQMFREKEPVELTGLWVVNDRGAMEYMYSGLVKALQQPSIICFDEYDSGNAVVTAMCNALLEGKPLILGNKGGEKIWPHPECIMVATGNTNGMGDDTGLYASTSVQSFATMNRFRMFVKIDYMPEEKEREVIKRVFPKLPEGRVKNIAKVAKLVRDGYIGGKVSCPLSTRQVLNWADWDMSTGESGRSFRLAFVNQLNETDAKVVGELYQRVYAKSIDED
ncbi:Hint domain-containing homing endonuclease [Azospirillum sp. Sh1]|uniref:Hint domain-containing homing endonuclease n=1 Tax=Azospirillum sp. Sh1 TaxID=2607285 RepID=UPI0011EEE1B7|nr:Hint domain-containing homing endonuclease [Azospirillum sp. Sh1]KAA0573413.1 AAA domain-containing protein [Azospirillum sp. Sh1]